MVPSCVCGLTIPADVLRSPTARTEWACSCGMTLNKAVELARGGDSNSFGIAYLLTQHALLGFLRKRMAGYSDSDIEDVAAQTTVKAWTGISAFDGRCAFLTWLTSIAIHALYDFQRKSQRLPVSFSDLRDAEECESRNVEREMSYEPRPDIVIDVRAAIDKLPARQSEVVRALLLGKTRREIASELGITPAGVSSLRDDAFKAMRTYLA